MLRQIAVLKKALSFFLLTTLEMIYSKTLSFVLNFSKNRFYFIPGLLFSSSIQIPESSAKHGTSNVFKPKDDLILALSAKLLPFSMGSFILS